MRPTLCRSHQFPLVLLLGYVVFPGVLRAGSTFTDCADCPQMVVVPPGSFEMGSPPGEAGEESDELPQRHVTIAHSFAVGANEITRAQFGKFVGATGYDTANECQDYESGAWHARSGATWRNPGFSQTDREPVVCVSWIDAQAFVQWLSRETGEEYRLLSEAEWEYVARAGNLWRNGIGHDRANYGTDKCCGRKQEGRDLWDYTAPVGSFSPDSLGLYDILGNVWEWVEDCYSNSYRGAATDARARTDHCSSADKRVLRGGSYGDGPELLHPAYRLRGGTGGRYVTLGFRVARSLRRNAVVK